MQDVDICTNHIVFRFQASSANKSGEYRRVGEKAQKPLSFMHFEKELEFRRYENLALKLRCIQKRADFICIVPAQHHTQ